MSTVYTYNNKVLKNSANDKWLAKKEAPAGYTKDSAILKDTRTAVWKSPTFPEPYDGSGHKLSLRINNNLVGLSKIAFCYWNSDETLPQVGSSGPQMCSFDWGAGGVFQSGTYESNISSNPATMTNYGVYFDIIYTTQSTSHDPSYDPVVAISDVNDLLDNIEISII